MKVAIVHDFLVKVGGAERVLEVLHQIFPEAPVYTLLYDEKGTKSFFSNGYDIRPSRLQKLPKFIRQRQKLLLAKFPQAIEVLDLSEYNLVISSSNSFAHGVITRPRTFHLTYCYSPMRYSWDWAHQYLKENNIGFGPIGLYTRSIVSKIRLWDYYASARTDKWVAISNTVAKRIRKYYQQKCQVIYPPANIDSLLKNNTKPKNYFLVVSRLTQYKNIDLAIKACDELKVPLYIIGEGSDLNRLKSLASSNIRFLGWQTDQDRNKYLSECKALIFPGEDDFGLTPVEAMAAGRPVVALNKGGATETVVAGKTGEFFDKTDKTDDLKSTIKKIINNYGFYKVEECKKQASRFSKQVFISNFSQFIKEEYKKYQDEIKT